MAKRLRPQREVNIWTFIAVLLLRNNDQDYNNPLRSFATCLCRQRSEHKRTGHCAKRIGGLADTTLPCPEWPRVHLSGPAYMPSCRPIHPEVRLPLDQRILCSDCCKKCKLLCQVQVVFCYFVLHSSKIPLVLTTKVTHLRSLLFRQPDGLNCVVRRVYFGVCPKQSSAVSGLWMLTVVHVNLRRRQGRRNVGWAGGAEKKLRAI